ncbi:hypothetical protein EPUS_09430 [Endocarpon pusillum Z07020]|uniref:Ig-like domain-containing protein n=1 Tax=Endocarpon pusillum (strain Z07020 / HMAS-L-300199) TaxID=1263415 RepID=U1G669_ENDPU|nr:uncharacterized protein EPUS_09430 [Endocarpon pusillum Z07020]ERF72857.1 hypothetical protein EPUS_09430 [Endocarpon pusillum Z07020]
MLHFTLSLCFFLLAIALCQETAFLYPPPSEESKLSFSVGDFLNATWVNSSDSPVLVLWCSRPNDGYASTFNSAGTSLQATGSLLVRLTSSSGDASNLCHLELRPDRNTNGTNSVNFALKAAADNMSPTIWGLGSSTESASSSTPTPSQTISSIADSTAGSTSSSTAAITPGASPSATVVPGQASSGLSASAKAVIGLGTGLAFTVGAVTVAIFLLVRKKARAKSRLMLGAEEVRYEQAPKSQLSGFTTATEYRPITEIDGASPSELPGASTMTGSRKP